MASGQAIVRGHDYTSDKQNNKKNTITEAKPKFCNLQKTIPPVQEHGQPQINWVSIIIPTSITLPMSSKEFHF